MTTPARMIVIYDNQCAYCRGFVQILKKLDKHKKFFVLPYEDQSAQTLLQAQFGRAFGFSMYLFEKNQVSWGREAAKRITAALSLPKALAELVFATYPAIVKFVSKLTGRTRAVCGPACLDRPLDANRLSVAINGPAAAQMEFILSVPKRTFQIERIT